MFRGEIGVFLGRDRQESLLLVIQVAHEFCWPVAEEKKMSKSAKVKRQRDRETVRDFDQLNLPSSPDLSAWDDLAWCEEGAGRQHAALAQDTAIHHHRAHPDKAEVLEGAPAKPKKIPRSGDSFKKGKG